MLLVPISQRRDAHWHFVADEAESEALLSKMKAVGDAIAAAEPRSLPALVLAATLHESVLAFVTFIQQLRAIDLSHMLLRPATLTLLSKVREYATYLDEKCQHAGLTMPNDWIDGLSFRRPAPSPLSDISDWLSGGNRSRSRNLTLATTVCSAVVELVQHMDAFCRDILSPQVAERRVHRQQSTDREAALDPNRLQLTSSDDCSHMVFTSADHVRLAARLDELADAMLDHGILLSLDLQNSSLHEKIAAFVSAVLDMPAPASIDGRVVAEKGREYLDYVVLKAAECGANHPGQWRLNGIMFADASRSDPECLATAVAEQIDHLHGLCLRELPQTRAERERLRWQEKATRVREEVIGNDRSRELPNVSNAAAARLSSLVRPEASLLVPRSDPWEPGVEVWHVPSPRLEATVTRSARPEHAKYRGAVPAITCRIEGRGQICEGDVVLIRVPLDSEIIWDVDFATIIAATLVAGDDASIVEVRFGIGDDHGLAYELTLPWRPPLHFEGGTRLAQRPVNPFLQFKVLLQATDVPFTVSVERIFAGHDYDPYTYNPNYARAAERFGRPAVPSGEETLATFERMAREACRTGTFVGAQAFIRPYLVTREGDPRFAMLIGSVNSMYWYGQEAAHGIESYRDWGCVAEGDVTIDCGSHAGQMSAYFAVTAGPRGRVIALDPFVQNTLQVEAQGTLNAPGRIRAIRARVGARRETISVSNLGQMTAGPGKSEVGDLTDIEIVLLDDFIEERPTLVKLDVEGAEVDALMGAQQLLAACRPRIFVEVHTQFLPTFGYTLTDFFSQFPSFYDVMIQVEGVDRQWRRFEAGMERDVTAPLLVFATARSSGELR